MGGWEFVPCRIVCRVMRLWGCCAVISTSMPIAHTSADTSTETPGPTDRRPRPRPTQPHPAPPSPRISEGNCHFQPGTRRKNQKHPACSLTSSGKGQRKNAKKGNGKEGKVEDWGSAQPLSRGLFVDPAAIWRMWAWFRDNKTAMACFVRAGNGRRRTPRS